MADREAAAFAEIVAPGNVCGLNGQHIGRIGDAGAWAAPIPLAAREGGRVGQWKADLRVDRVVPPPALAAEAGAGLDLAGRVIAE